MRCGWAVLLLLALVNWAVAEPLAERRMALVIGNADYPRGAALFNPLNDARAMAERLRELGFEVDYHVNLPQREMNRVIGLWGSRLPADAVALFYYAGHGLQIAGRNYLVPVDARIVGEASAMAEAVDAQVLLEQLRQARMGLLILDACRDNPFERRFRSSATRGLAQMDAPAGVLIAYATAPGRVASDGAGRHSLYTGALLEALKLPGLRVEDVFKRVRAQVMHTSQGEQVPWEASSLLGDFYFLQADTSLVAPPSLADQSPSGFEAGAPLASRSARTARVAGESFRDCASCPELVVLPSGRFSRGSPAAERGRFSDEGPLLEEVIAKPFALASRETRLDEFRRFIRATGYRTSAERHIGAQGCFAWDEVSGRWGWRGEAHWQRPGFPQDDAHPVVCISWHDAQAYVRWLSETTGQRYRLPTEYEYEYAARAGTSTSRYWGEQAEAACLYANVEDVGASQTQTWRDKHPCDDRQAATARVGSYVPNGFGLYDMLGNVAEWTGDCWTGTATDCPGRVHRGGGWSDGPRTVRSAYRGRLAPDGRTDFLGFRVARDIE